MSSKKKGHLDGSDGFTLIELMIILVVLAVIAAIAISNLMGAYDRAKQGATVADMRSIASAIQAYAIDHSSPPPLTGNFNDLVLTLRLYQQSGIPDTDHWGHTYVYTTDGASYSVMSYGKDGVDGSDLTWNTRNEFERDIVVNNGVFVAGPEVR
jgi:general secretion pathway protein G